jgi:hypothetical protein
MSIESKLPLWFALAGAVIAVGYAVASCLIFSFNLLHPPTYEQRTGVFVEPFRLRLFESLMWWFCPASLLLYLTAGRGEAVNLAMGAVVALVNGAIYGWIGVRLAELAALRRFSRHRRYTGW